MNIDIDANRKLIVDATDINYHAKIIRETDSIGVLHTSMNNLIDMLDMFIIRLSGATAVVEVLSSNLETAVEEIEGLKADLEIAEDNADDL